MGTLIEIKELNKTFSTQKGEVEALHQVTVRMEPVKKEAAIV
jgi:hypothetical protein